MQLADKGSGRSRAKQAKCPLTDPVKRPYEELYEVLAGHVITLRQTVDKPLPCSYCAVASYAKLVLAKAGRQDVFDYFNGGPGQLQVILSRA